MFLITDQVLQRSLSEGVFKGLVQMNQSFLNYILPSQHGTVIFSEQTTQSNNLHKIGPITQNFCNWIMEVQGIPNI